MATNQVTKTENKLSMSQVLASNGIKQLGENLMLTQEQKMKATSTALSLSSNPNLVNCDPFSIAKYCFETARYNFSREDCVYPVPYKNAIQAQISYKGFREIALRAGYKDVNCSIVYDCDKITRNRQTGKIIVEFEEDYTKSLNAKLIGFYAYAIDSDGELSNSLFFTTEQCREHGKKYSKTFDNGVWATEFNKMARKTVIKALCGELKSTPELESLRKLDQIVLGRGEYSKNEYEDNPLNYSSNRQSVSNDSIIDGKELVDEATGEVSDTLPLDN